MQVSGRISAAENGAMNTRDDIVSRYLAYLNACNRRAWEELRGYLAETVLVNGSAREQDEYLSDLLATINTFPDYQWRLVRAVVEGEWLAVHLHDVGTRSGLFLGAPGDDTRVETQEFDMYRIIGGRIHEVEGTADNARLRL
jgi:predicted ester cyclase